MKTCLKFSCIYCGQRMECETCLRGRQMLCPGCRHKIAIPVAAPLAAIRRLPALADTWDTWLPFPMVELPERLRALAPKTALARTFAPV